ncbi:MAG: RsmD family RNA methyltransferase, partial [Myxococcota bacterium]|nr:RsmD family RNA methyltransferase [Myxococcota bacterium]
MRVTGGELAGRRLRTPRGASVRPTADRVRESLFGRLGPLDGCRVLDLYAGSGALGIEALSRGAAHALFVDRAAACPAGIRRNLEALGLGGRAEVRRGDAVAT